MARRYSAPGTYFNDFTVITAKYPSTCSCGKVTPKGEQIAWTRRQVKCMDCYRAWASEVQEESDMCDRNVAIMDGYFY